MASGFLREPIPEHLNQNFPANRPAGSGQRQVSQQAALLVRGQAGQWL
jgi:hypothetical protein